MFSSDRVQSQITFSISSLNEMPSACRRKETVKKESFKIDIVVAKMRVFGMFSSRENCGEDEGGKLKFVALKCTLNSPETCPM